MNKKQFNITDFLAYAIPKLIIAAAIFCSGLIIGALI